MFAFVPSQPCAEVPPDPKESSKYDLNTALKCILRRNLQKGEIACKTTQFPSGFKCTVTLPCLPGKDSRQSWTGEACLSQRVAEEDACRIALAALASDSKLADMLGMEKSSSRAESGATDNAPPAAAEAPMPRTRNGKSKWDIVSPEAIPPVPPPPPTAARIHVPPMPPPPPRQVISPPPPSGTCVGSESNWSYQFPPEPPACAPSVHDMAGMQLPMPPPPPPPPHGSPAAPTEDTVLAVHGSNERAASDRSRSPLRRRRRDDAELSDEKADHDWRRHRGNLGMAASKSEEDSETKWKIEEAEWRQHSRTPKTVGWQSTSEAQGDTRPLPTPARALGDTGSNEPRSSNLLVDAFAAARAAEVPQYHSFENFHGSKMPPPGPTPTSEPKRDQHLPTPSAPMDTEKDENERKRRALSNDLDREQLDKEERERRIKIMNESLENMSKETRDRFNQLIEEGTIQSIREFDLKCLYDLLALSQPLQLQVLDYLEAQKVFLVNSRSKSGFLVSVCERARQGALDARGLFAKDPWKDHLSAVASAKRPQIELIPEQAWLQKHGAAPVQMIVNINAVALVAGLGPGVETVSFKVHLTETVRNVKQRLAAIGIEIPVHKMKIRASPVGFLNDAHTLAHYNLLCSSELQLFYKTRAGVARKKDQSDGFDPRFCEAGFPSNHAQPCCTAEEYIVWAMNQHSQPTVAHQRSPTISLPCP